MKVRMLVERIMMRLIQAEGRRLEERLSSGTRVVSVTNDSAGAGNRFLNNEGLSGSK